MRRSSCAKRVAALVMMAVLAGPAAAQNLQGRWQFHRQGHNGGYSGTLIIEQGGQVRLKGRSPTQNYSECGHMEMKGAKVEIVFTSAQGEYGYSADHFYCTAPDGRSLSCINIDEAGHGGESAFVLERLDNVPSAAEGRLEGVCPAQETPRS